MDNKAKPNDISLQKTNKKITLNKRLRDYASTKHKKAEVVLLGREEANFRMRNIIKDKERHLIMMIKESRGHNNHKYISTLKTIFKNI